VDSQLCNSDRQREYRPKYAHSPRDTVGRGRRYPVSEQHTPKTESHVDGDEQNAERVMGNEPHVPRVGQETHGGT